MPHEKPLDATLKPWLKTPAGVTAFVTYVIRNAAKTKVDTPQSVKEFNEVIASLKRDYLSDFATSFLVTDPSKLTPLADIVKVYIAWCEQERTKPVNDTTLGLWLKDRYRLKKVNGKRGYEIALNKPLLRAE